MTKIAIIGTSALFPGSSTNEEFWDNLLEGRDLTSHATKEDFGADPDLFFNPEKGVEDKTYSLRGGFIRDFKFDPNGYKVDADYLSRQDKLYQWSLHAANEALRDGGYGDDEKWKRRCGLVLGNLSFPTSTSHPIISSLYLSSLEKELQRILGEPKFSLSAEINKDQIDDILKYTPSELVSKALGLQDSHYSLDAACATSLYAIKLACDELITGKSDLMLAGAISASDQLFIHMGFSIFHAYAPRGSKFVPFDKASSGLVSSEGIGMVLLKRLEDAQRDGDKILALVGGVGLSNDGRGKFLLSPNPEGQQLAFDRAYTSSGLDPKNTSYLECHATGTPLGDVTELNSIASFFSQYGATPLLGSVKSNMGHLLTAAGMTGLLKVILAMQKEVIPPNINLEEPIASDNNWEGDANMITKVTPWTGDQAGINSFGFGGTNAHMVVQKYNDNPAHSEPRVELRPMSIVGMDAHFGPCKNLQDFYSTIYFGKQAFIPLPNERWKGIEDHRSLLNDYGWTQDGPPKGGYIDEFEIDLLRYKIQPKDAERLQPQQALILKVADQAIQDAQLKESENVAVLIAMETELALHQYLSRWDLEWQMEEALEKLGIELDAKEKDELIHLSKNALYSRSGKPVPSEFTSFVGNIMASRIAALWDFSGPAFTVSSGRESTQKALEIAQNMLSRNEVDAVVVGAVDFAAGVEHVLLRNHKNPLNTKEKASLSINTGDQGWLVGEGAGAVVLKAYDPTSTESAYSVLEEIGPSKKKDQFGYLELCNNGVVPADVEEAKRLEQFKGGSPMAVGSVKTNIGDTFAASGMAALIKTTLCIHHKFIPGVPNWQALSDDVAIEDVNVYFPERSRPWILQDGQDERRAGIHTGNQKRMVLRAAKVEREKKGAFLKKHTPHLVLISGNNVGELLLGINDCLTQEEQQLSDFVRSKFIGWSEAEKAYNLVLVARDQKELQREASYFKNKISEAIAEGGVLQTPSGSYFTAAPLANEAGNKIAFVYPGSATAYKGLGQDLFQGFPAILDKLEDQLGDLDTFIGSDYLYPKKKSIYDEDPNLYSDAIAMMSTGVFYAYVFTHLLRDVFKVEPDMAFGYSMGECSSMWYALDVWHPDGAEKFRSSPIFKNRFAGNLELLAEHWGVSSEEAKERWTSRIVLAPVDRIKALIENHEHAYLTFVNTPDEAIISGDKTIIEGIIAELQCADIEVPFQNVIHHDFCKKETDGLLDMHDFKVVEHPNIEFYSSVNLDRIPLSSKAIAKNSLDVCADKVDFPRLMNGVYEKNARIFIEVGANATCTQWTHQILKGRPYLSAAINQKGRSDIFGILSLLSQLISHGIRPDLSSVMPEEKQGVKKASFLKKIYPGGANIPEAFKGIDQGHYNIKKTGIHQSADVLEVQPVQARVMALAGVDEDVVATIKDIELKVSDPKGTPTGSAKNKNSDMKSSVMSPGDEVKKKENRIGENGLILQDYEAGEHLEGKEIVFSQEDLVEFATGKIANVFGPEYAIIDTYRRRVMLPMDPYLLVSRVTKMNAKLGEYVPSTMTTEYDVPYNAWYSTDGQIPSAVCVESGQCDLLLISYLGIDLANKGDLVYRLLDCTLTFMDDLPLEGQTLRYDISINSFVRNGENLLFFFSYMCYVQDRLVLKMDGGCAGFFADDQLTEGAGVVYANSEIEARQNAEKKHFTPLLNTHKTAFSKEDLRHLINGDIEKCFDDISYRPNGRNKSLRIPPEDILMLDRITEVDLKGGAYGLGTIVAEKDLHPDDWFFPCHFRDDEVLAGSLQAEGGGNLLRFFMLLLGLQRLTKDARFQPVCGVRQKVRCRKQVTTADTKLIYKLEIKEIGLVPNPYVIGDLEIISDGVITVHFENLSLQLREKDQPKYLHPQEEVTVAERSAGALLNEKDITTFALGDLTECFGQEFAVYKGRKISRQPNTDLQLISRVLKIDGQRGDFSKPSTCYAEYDVPADAWYYQQNAHMTMPYSILMEIALQPCGLMGAYLGSTLQFPDQDLYFRNLDGEGTLLDLPSGTDFRGKTISNKAVLVSSIAHGGNILQRYTFELSIDGKVFYQGNSSFGFFTKDALASQVGLDKGEEVPAWYLQKGWTSKDYMTINLDSLYGKMKLFKAPEGKPNYKLSADQLNLLDTLRISKEGGEHGQGYIHATRKINTYDWFFTCHFYEDSVMPGSLGVEAIFQAIQVYALQQDLGKGMVSPRFTHLDQHKTVWKYRGQILSDVDEMHLEVHVKGIEGDGRRKVLKADAYLWNGSMRIYQVTDLALCIEDK